MKDLEKQYKALGNKRRLLILQYLKNQHSASVGEIAHHLKITLKSTSKHLSRLLAVDALEREQKSLSVMYSLNKHQKSAVKHALALL